MEEWTDIGSKVTPAQRRALYRFLSVKRIKLRELIARLSEEDASSLLSILIRTVCGKDGGECR